MKSTIACDEQPGSDFASKYSSISCQKFAIPIECETFSI
jgi:hypothetical protein